MTQSLAIFFLLLPLVCCEGNWTLIGTSVEVTVVTTSTVSIAGCEANCSFIAPFLGSTNLGKFPKNCSTVCASPLYIGAETDLTEKQLTNAFKNMKHFMGDLIVNGSRFKSGKFLAGLETIDCDNTGFFQWTLNENLTEIGLPSLTTIACRVHISSNKKLVHLNLPKMIPTPVSSNNTNNTGTDLAILNNSPDLCITIQEMSNFMLNENVNVIALPQKYCPALTNSNSTDKVCSFDNKTMATMETECVQVHGDVVLTQDEDAVKLESVRNIFGSLTIDGTNLTSLDFLINLEEVFTLRSNQTAICVQYNSNLANVSFPSLKRIFADTIDSMVFQNNSEELLKDPSTCLGIRNGLNTSDVNIPIIDGLQCEAIKKPEVVKDKSGNQLYNNVMLWMFIFIVMLI